MSETILYIGPVAYTAERLEQLATTAGLSFRSRYAPHEVVLIVARERPLDVLSFCRAQALIAVSG